MAWAEAKYEAILDGCEDLDETSDNTKDKEDKEDKTIGETMRSFSVKKEITSSLTFTASQEMDWKEDKK